MTALRPALAAIAAALCVLALFSLPAKGFLPREGFLFFHTPPSALREAAPSSGSDLPCDAGDRKEGEAETGGCPVEDLFVAAGHFTNQTRLEIDALPLVYEGTVVQWSQAGRVGAAGPIEIYTADPPGLERAGLPAARVRTLETWEAVIDRLERDPDAVALVPVTEVRPSVRVLSGPVHADGRPAPALPVRTVTVAGDVMLGNWIEAMALAKWVVTGEEGYPFGSIAPYLAEADLAMANLEFVASEGPRLGGLFGIRFRSGPWSLDRIRATGIDLVSLANNHTLDYGGDAIFEMMAGLDARNIRHVGAGPSPLGACAPRFESVGEARVAVMALTDVPPNQPIPRHSSLYVADTARLGTRSKARRPGESVLDADGTVPSRPPWEAALRKARAESDVVVVMIHWGKEFLNKQNENQRRLARRMADLGADLVVGAHPHCVQGVEWHGGCAVFYSLGNLVFGLNELPGPVGAVSDGALLQCRILGRRLYQFDLVPVAETLGSPVPPSLSTPAPGLPEPLKRTLLRIYRNSTFGT